MKLFSFWGTGRVISCGVVRVVWKRSKGAAAAAVRARGAAAAAVRARNELSLENQDQNR